MDLDEQRCDLPIWKETENGANAYNSTLDPLLDLFGTIGAMRNMPSEEIIRLFSRGYSADRLLAMKTLFYARDCRGGLGERETTRLLMKWLAKNHTQDMALNLALIPEYGRFDDLYAFVGTPLEDQAFSVLKAQFDKDLEDYSNNRPISNCAKWLKSCNATSKETRMLGQKTAKAFGLTEKQYRQKLSMLRGYSNVVETKMSSQHWSEIDYPAVPSYAALRYKDAFMRHDEERYSEYLSDVAKGNTKINSSTLFPYDLVSKYTRESDPVIDETIEAQWKALPNYVSDGKKFLVMADTSGSMYGRPLDTSVGLAIYFAERNTGPYHGKFITFTDIPLFFDLPDNLSLAERVFMACSQCGYNTNLEMAFQLVLDTAISAKVKQEDLPDAILVISDMEIDEFDAGENNISFTESMKAKFAAAGYEMPTLVYWNVDARSTTFHATANEKVRFISGSSASVFKGLCEHMGYSATELMLSELNSERYSAITVAD